MPLVKIKKTGSLVAKKEVVRKLFCNRTEFWRTASSLDGHAASLYIEYKSRHKIPMLLVELLAGALGYDKAEIEFV